MPARPQGLPGLLRGTAVLRCPEPGASPKTLVTPPTTHAVRSSSAPGDTHQLPILEPCDLRGWKAICVTLERQRLPGHARHVSRAPVLSDAGGHLGSKKQRAVPSSSSHGDVPAIPCGLDRKPRLPALPKIPGPIIRAVTGVPEVCLSSSAPAGQEGPRAAGGCSLPRDGTVLLGPRGSQPLQGVGAPCPGSTPSSPHSSLPRPGRPEQGTTWREQACPGEAQVATGPRLVLDGSAGGAQPSPRCPAAQHPGCRSGAFLLVTGTGAWGQFQQLT